MSVKENFETWLFEIAKNNNSFALSDESYNKIVTFLKADAKEVHGKYGRKFIERVRRNKYCLMDYSPFAIKDMLCVPIKKKELTKQDQTGFFGNYKRVARIKEIYDIINEAHVKEGNHNGEKKTLSKIKDTTVNITMGMVKYFMAQCTTCALKSSQLRSAPLKPIISKGFMERIQIDLIDMIHEPDVSFKFICHICDHFSKFRVICPLITKEPGEVAKSLKENFLSYFGLPKIIQSDNGYEFVDDLIKALISTWPGNAKVINGSPRHSQSQGLVEQGNSTIRRMIAARKHDEISGEWSKWLPEIQYSMNTSVVSSIKMSPFECVFGQKPNRLHAFGVQFSGNIYEDEIEDIVENSKEVESQEYPEFNAISDEETLVNFNIHQKTFSSVDASESFEVTCDSRKSLRKQASENLDHSRELMKSKYSRAKKIEGSIYAIDQHVSLLIPKRMRSKSNLKRLPCVVISRSTGCQPNYGLMCEFGVLKGRFTSADLMPYPGTIVRCNPEVKISLQMAAAKFITGAAVLCNCKGECKSNVCYCKKLNVPCDSRCHQGQNENCINNVKNKSVITVPLPKYGGRYGVNNTIYRFINTCPLDTWFAIIRLIDIQKLLRFEIYSETFRSLLGMIRQNDYEGGRLLVATEVNISSNLDYLSFYGSEYDLFIKPFLLDYFRSYLNSTCSNESCPEPNIIIETDLCPAVSISNREISSEEFEREVNKWFTNEDFGRCGQRMDQNMVKDCYFIDENESTGEINHYCNGQRKIYKRLLFNQPHLLPVNVEALRIGSSFPVTIKILSDNSFLMFDLRAISLCNSNHYIGKILYEDQWILFDGKVKDVELTNIKEIPKGYHPTYCLYVLRDASSTEAEAEKTVANEIITEVDKKGVSDGEETVSCSGDEDLIALNKDPSDFTESLLTENEIRETDLANDVPDCHSDDCDDGDECDVFGVLKPFSAMTIGEKQMMILYWLTDREIAPLIFGQEEYLSIGNIKFKSYKKLPDSFKDNVVDIGIIQNFTKEDFFRHLQQMINRKQKEKSWKCLNCRNKVVSHSIGCDRCLEWAHFSCLGLTSKPSGDWYCPKCVKEVNIAVDAKRQRKRKHEEAELEELQWSAAHKFMRRITVKEMGKWLGDSKDQNKNPFLHLMGSSRDVFVKLPKLREDERFRRVFEIENEMKDDFPPPNLTSFFLRKFPDDLSIGKVSQARLRYIFTMVSLEKEFKDF